MLKRIISMIFAAALLCSLGMNVFAVDFSETGSVRIHMRDGGRAVSGGTVTVYRVAGIQEKDGAYVFVLTDGFEDSRVKLDDVQDPDVAQALANYADRKNYDGDTKTVGISGSVTLSNLEVGLYLIVQERAAPGYYPIKPFLISVPSHDGDEYDYSVDASPKVELEPVEPSWPSEPTCPSVPTIPEWPTEPERPTEPEKPTEPEQPTEPESPTEPEKPTQPDQPDEPTETEPEDTTQPGKPDKPQLPQTGQLNWPVSLLVVSGMTLLVIGWMIRRGWKEEYEK